MSASDESLAKPPAPGLKVQVIAALRWSAIAKFGGQIINWGITLFVIRLLTAADYGLVAMIGIIFMFLTMLGELGFGSSIAQSPTLDEREIRQTLGAAIVVNLLICALLIAAAPSIAAFYDEPRLIDMVRVAALAFLGSGIPPVYAGLLQRDMRFKTNAKIEIATGMVGNAATLVLAWLGYGAWALVIGGLIGNPLRIVLLLASAKQVYRPSFGFRGTRRLWTFGGNLLITRVVWYWSAQADTLIAGKFLGKEALGVYSVAVHLASLPMQRAAGIINGVAFAAFAKIQHDPVAVAENTRLGVRLMALVTFPVLWGIAAVSPELVRVAIGPTWTAAILPLTLVALTIPFKMISSIVATTIMSVGRMDIAMVTTVLGAIVAPPLFFIGSRYGILGLSLAWVVITPVMFLLNTVRALPILGLSMRVVLGEIYRPLLAAAMMYIAVAGMRMVAAGLPDIAMFALLIVVGAAVYCGGSWMLNRSATVEALLLLFPGRFARLRVHAASAP